MRPSKKNRHRRTRVAAAYRNFIPPNIGKNTHSLCAPLLEIIQQPLHHKASAEPEADILDHIVSNLGSQESFKDIERIMVIIKPQGQWHPSVKPRIEKTSLEAGGSRRCEMSTLLEIKGRKIRVDANGYLTDQNDWNEEVALALAAHEGIDTLSREQLDIIHFMREYFLKYKVFPILNHVCRITHQPKECVSEKFVNPEKAWKIAGLPKQDGVHFVSLDGEHYFMEPYC